MFTNLATLALLAGVSLVEAIPLWRRDYGSAPTTSSTPSNFIPIPLIVGPNPTGTSQASTSSNSTSSNSTLIAGSWITGYHLNDTSDLNNISFSKYTHMTYSFASPRSDGSFLFDIDGVEPTSGQDFLTPFVSLAHQNNVKALISVGGWYGSRFFSNLVAPENRTQFVQSVANLTTSNNLDGVEIDWEYPGNVGACNSNSPDDASNLVEFFQELRASLGSNVTLTAAVPGGSSNWVTGGNSSVFPALAGLLDFISIMNYDTFGSFSSTAGPNAPLDDTCDVNPQGSAKTAIADWTSVGFSPSQLVLGVPSYAHTFSVSNANATSDNFQTLNSHPGFDNQVFPFGGEDVGFVAGQADVCGVVQQPSGVWEYGQLVDAGFITADGNFTQPDNVFQHFDECSQTPIIYNATSQEWISYDDPTSFLAKGQFIVNNSIAGFAMFETTDDRNDALLDAIRLGMGLQ